MRHHAESPAQPDQNLAHHARNPYRGPMRHSFTGKRTIARGLALATAVTLTLGIAACGDGESTEDTARQTTNGTATTTDTTTTTTDSPAATTSAADDAEAGSSSSEEAPESEPYTMTQGSTTVTVSPGQTVPLNEIMTVSWNSEGQSSCGTILTLMTAKNEMLRFEPDAGCSGEFSESLDESLGATAGTWTLTLMGTPDGDIELPIEVG